MSCHLDGAGGGRIGVPQWGRDRARGLRRPVVLSWAGAESGKPDPVRPASRGRLRPHNPMAAEYRRIRPVLR